MQCPDDNTVAELMAGLVTGERLRLLESHVNGCSSCGALLAGVGRTSDPGEDLPSGATFGRYEVLERIGRGAMGTVYAARDPLLARRVALKILHRSADEIPELRARILREGRALARLSHPNVVSLYDVGEESGRLFLAMEIVPGETLGAWLRARPRSWQAIVGVFQQAAGALAAAHEAGIVHGDFKPDNVIVGAGERAYVMDFGLAREHSPDDGGEHPPLLAGTPAYMAPEQLEGARATPASDQFSFCVALREALDASGARPPPWLAAVAARGLEADPARRFSSMKELRERVASKLAGAAHYAINACLQLLMLPFHVAVTTLFVWAFASSDPPSHYHATHDAAETISSAIVGWLAVLFFTGWAPLGAAWTACNAYGLFRRRRWALTSTLIYAASLMLTCFAAPIAVYAFVSLWPLRKKTATSAA